MNETNSLGKRETYLPVWAHICSVPCPSQNAQHAFILRAVSIQDTVFNLHDVVGFNTKERQSKETKQFTVKLLLLATLTWFSHYGILLFTCFAAPQLHFAFHFTI